MSDRFLYQVRPPVRQEFSEELYSQINQEPAWGATMFRALAARLRRPQVVAAFLLILALFAACAQKILSTNFRAADEVAGITIYETNYLLIEPRVIDLNETPDYTFESSTEDTDDLLNSPLTIEESLVQLSFIPQLPTWMPPDFENDPGTIDVPGDGCLWLHYHSIYHRGFVFIKTCEGIEDEGEGMDVPARWEEIWFGRSASSIKVAPGKWSRSGSTVFRRCSSTGTGTGALSGLSLPRSRVKIMLDSFGTTRPGTNCGGNTTESGISC